MAVTIAEISINGGKINGREGSFYECNYEKSIESVGKISEICESFTLHHLKKNLEQTTFITPYFPAVVMQQKLNVTLKVTL